MASKTPTIKIEYPSSKKATKKQDDEFLHAVCALANGEGGRIILRAKKNEGYSEKDVDDISRKLEQKTFDLFGFSTANKMVRQEKVLGELETSELIFSVQACPLSQQPCTVKYNLYFATESQVKLVDSSETVQSVIKDIVEKKPNPNGVFEFGSHHRSFPIGEAIPLRDSKNTQFKCLKDEELETCNLVTRMHRNNLTSYVSAFANGEGGHIYYGIKAPKDGSNVVVGQVVKNKDTIIDGVEKIIKKMLWPNDYGRPRMGEHWQIFFEPVSGVDEKCNLFVIVIAIAPSSEPVFIDEPESYQETDGQVTKLSYPEWEKRLRRHRISHRAPIVEIPPRQKCEWSSKKAQQTHIEIDNKLTQLRNQGDQAFLTEINEVRLKLGDNSNVEVILQHQEAAYYFMKGNLEKGEKHLIENERYVAKCQDPKIYEFRRLYWLCIMKRSNGELEESDKHSSNAIERAESIPPMLMEAWLLVDKVKKIEIEIATTYDPKQPQNCEGLIKKCVDIYYKAIGKADTAQDAKYGLVNLKQMVHISLARIFLGSFQNQGKIIRTAGWKLEDLEKAAKMFEIVDRWRHREGHTMTQLCKCEYLLARCEQDIRNWEHFKNPDYFYEVREDSARALKIAEMNEFKILYCYAFEQHAYLDAELKS